MFDYKDELNSDGYKVLPAKEIRELLEETLKSKARKIAIFSRRSVLRIAMILRDSDVAKTIRTYLLNHEEHMSSESLVRVANQLALQATQLSQSAKQLMRLQNHQPSSKNSRHQRKNRHSHTPQNIWLPRLPNGQRHNHYPETIQPC